MSFNPQTLPSNDNVNPYAFCLDVEREVFIQKGRMIAYYGSLRFETLGSGPLDVLTKEAFNSPLFVRDYVVVTGRGKLILGDRGNHVNSFDLDNGNLTVKSEHVLGFESTLVCQESVVEGYLTLLGTGKFLASSNGQVHFLEPPVRVDEQALLGWADVPCPAFRYDYNHVRGVIQAMGTAMGVRSSGEEKQVDFSGAGTVLVQSSEEQLLGRSNLQAIIAQVSGLHQSDLQQLSSVVTQKLRGN
jgi:uncharacterized protein (AIM24 family)